MEALQAMVGLFLLMAQGCTHEMPDTVYKHKDDKILVSMFDCGNRRFRVLSAFCEQGKGFWSYPFLVEHVESGMGFYMNQFAEIQAGHQIRLNKSFMPACVRYK